MGKMPKKFNAYFLAFFFGGFGAHCFYLNKPIRGLSYLLFCWTGIPFLLGWMDMLSIQKWMKREGNTNVGRSQSVNVIKQIGESFQKELRSNVKEFQTSKKTEKILKPSKINSVQTKKISETKTESKSFYDEQSMVLEEYKQVTN
jgi:TM2 domain-containing membrane protein YozV